MPCLVRMRWNCLGDLAVHARHDAVEELDHRHLGAEPAPDRAHLEPDIAAADHHQMRSAPWPAPARRSRRRSASRRSSTPGSGITSEPVAMTMFLASSVCSPPPSASRRPCRRPAAAPAPLTIGRPCSCLNRNSMPLVRSSTTLSLRASIAGRSSATPADLDAVRRQMRRRLLVELRGLQQRLRGDAADIEAGAAERAALLDAGRLEAELRRADRGDIAAGAAADDDDVDRSQFGHEGILAEDKRRSAAAPARRPVRVFLP